MSELPWRQKAPTTNCWVQTLPWESSDPRADEQSFLGDLSSAPTEVPLIPRRGMNRRIAVKRTNFSSCICLIGTLRRTWLQREPGGEWEITQVRITNVLKFTLPWINSSRCCNICATAVPGQSPALGWEVSFGAGDYLIVVYKGSTWYVAFLCHTEW